MFDKLISSTELSSISKNKKYDFAQLENIIKMVSGTEKSQP